MAAVLSLAATTSAASVTRGPGRGPSLTRHACSVNRRAVAGRPLPPQAIGSEKGAVPSARPGQIAAHASLAVAPARAQPWTLIDVELSVCRFWQAHVHSHASSVSALLERSAVSQRGSTYEIAMEVTSVALFSG